MKKRVLVLLTALIMALTMSAGTVFAGGDSSGGDGDDGKEKRVCVKHFTGSEKNPYNFLWLPKKAALKHKDNHGDVIYWEVTSKEECKALDDTPR